MAHILLGVTGSVAAIRTPLLYRRLRDDGHDVRIVATEPALHFFDSADIADEHRLFRDAHEWPIRTYRRGDPVLHIEFRKWADLLVVAPLDANTLGKFALGLCDNFLTCLFRAWDLHTKPVVLAPAMNTMMWDSPVTLRHLRQLIDDWGDSPQPARWALEDADAIFARHAHRLVLVPPTAKELACGDVGIGAMAEVETIAEAVGHLLGGGPGT
jgi:phosphopantothenoylcysteine decarboxylase